MSLEATLLTEQKTRKIIELLKELRRDSPEIPDREDIEPIKWLQKLSLTRGWLLLMKSLAKQP
jgi:hypothetical protein